MCRDGGEPIDSGSSIFIPHINLSLYNSSVSHGVSNNTTLFLSVVCSGCLTTKGILYHLTPREGDQQGERSRVPVGGRSKSVLDELYHFL